MVRLLLALAAAAAVGLARGATPVALEFTGNTNGLVYRSVPLGKFNGAVFRDGVSVRLQANTPGCYTACLTDVVAAYPDRSAWNTGQICQKVLVESQQFTTAYLRPESLHIVLYQQIVGNCLYRIEVTGDLCDADRYGFNCTARKPAPTEFTLTPGESYTFEGAYNPDRRYPQYAYVSYSFSTAAADPVQALLYVAGRTFDEPRILGFVGDTGNVHDNATLALATQASKQYQLEIASPARLFSSYAGVMRIPLFWSFHTPANNTEPITVKILAVDEVECALENYAGRACELFTPYVDKASFYKYTWSKDGKVAPHLDFLDATNFTFGVTATAGQVYALLRYGNVPSASNFDLAMPLADATDSAKATRYYVSDDPVDTQEAPWFVAFFTPQLNVDATYVFWMNSECPADCSGKGTCINNVCLCQDNLPAPACTTEEATNPTTLPPRDRHMTSASTFFIVWGVLGFIALVGLWAYLHRRRSQAASGYANVG